MLKSKNLLRGLAITLTVAILALGLNVASAEGRSFFKKSRPTQSICQNQQGGDGVYELCRRKSISHESGAKLTFYRAYKKGYAYFKVNAFNHPRYLKLKLNKTTRLEDNGQSIDLTYLGYKNKKAKLKISTVNTETAPELTFKIASIEKVYVEDGTVAYPVHNPNGIPTIVDLDASFADLITFHSEGTPGEGAESFLMEVHYDNDVEAEIYGVSNNSLSQFVNQGPGNLKYLVTEPGNYEISATVYNYDPETEETGLSTTEEVYFDTDDNVSRCQLIAAAMDKRGIFSGIPEDNPTFQDVPSDHWCYEYVENAVNYGLVHGYADDEGNLLGIFRPDDLLSRAETVKFILDAFDFDPTVDDDYNPFSDVDPDAWFADYVNHAYAQDIIDGPPDHPFFRPGNTALYEWVMNTLDRALNVYEYNQHGHLLVELSADTPEATTLARGQEDVEFLKFDLDAENEDAIMDQLNLSLGGLASPSDFGEVKLWNANDESLLGNSFIRPDGTVDFHNLDYIIEEDQDKTFLLTASINNHANSGNAYFYIDSSEDIVASGGFSSADIEADGDFPINGNAMSIMDIISQGTLTVSPGEEGDTPTLFPGEPDISLLTLDFNARYEDIMTEKLTFTIDGQPEIINYEAKLWHNGTQLGETGYIMPDNTVTFYNLDFVVEDGDTETIIVSGIIGDDAPGGSLAVILDSPEDVDATGLSSGSNVDVEGDFPFEGNLISSYGVLDVSLSASSPLYSEIHPGEKDVRFAEFDFRAEREDIIIEDLDLLQAGLPDVRFDQIKLWDKAGTLLKTAYVGPDNMVNFNNFDLVVEDGTTETLTVTASINETSPTGPAYFQIDEADDLVATGRSSGVDIEARGEFPLLGNLMMILQ
jgi:hypothetical protein